MIIGTNWDVVRDSIEEIDDPKVKIVLSQLAIAIAVVEKRLEMGGVG